MATRVKATQTPEREETFQETADRYAQNSIANMRDELADEGTRERICSEGALMVEVRPDWYAPGTAQEEEDRKPAEYSILLGTGGPASRIIGKLDRWCQPETAIFEYQDWFKPWTAARTTVEEDAILLEYARQFYFGE